MIRYLPSKKMILLTVLLMSVLVLSACSARSASTTSLTPTPEPTPTTEPTRTELPEHEEAEPPAKPDRFQLDTLDVDAEIEHVAKDDEGRMAVPEEPENVAWYELGPRPGEQGNAVMAGHYDSFSGPAVFYELGDIEEGEILRVVTDDDEEIEFEVYEIESVHIDDADSEKIFGETDEYNLNLVTCEGIWDPDMDMYDHRLIVYARMVDS